VAKLRHIRLDNLIRLSGFDASTAAHAAEVLDENIEGLITGKVDARPEGQAFQRWRRLANWSRHNVGEFHFQFDVVRIWGPDKNQPELMKPADLALVRAQPMARLPDETTILRFRQGA
jgi:hypothetical protein